MCATEFKEQNVLYGKDQPEYLPLPAYRCNDEQGRIVFCWSFSLKERLLVLFTGKLWHEVLTFDHPLQPQRVSVEKPQF